jgi:putative transposase
VLTRPLLDRIDNFAAFLAEAEQPEASAALRAAETTGRPLGNEAFIKGLERILGRKLARGRPGPAPKAKPMTRQQDLWG